MLSVFGGDFEHGVQGQKWGEHKEKPSKMEYSPRNPEVEMEAHYNPAASPGEKGSAYISAIQRKAGAPKGSGATEVKNFEKWVSENGGGIINGSAVEGSRGFWKKMGYSVGDRNRWDMYPIQKEVPSTETKESNPGVDSAISDWPPDMKVKPQKGEADKNLRGHNQQFVDRVLSQGDFGKSKGGRY